MAQIDVTDLLVDPDLVDVVQLITRVPRVNARGENLLNECVVTTVGSVQPASGRAIQRLPDAMRVANISSFWVKSPTIETSAPGRYASILIFKGRRYAVQTVQDWSNWGPGWCEGTCVAEVPAP